MDQRTIKTALRQALPRPLIRIAKRVRYAGPGRTCHVCGATSRRFLPQGYGYEILEALEVVGGMRKDDDECPMCHTADRTRLVDLYVSDHTDMLTRPCRLLHVAPEIGLAEKWSAVRDLDYVPADLDRARYRHLSGFTEVDLQNAPFDSQSFDWVVCNHVLEHVPDDRRAMREIFRILKPGGTAILQVPIALRRRQTEEDPTLTDEHERIRRFGQSDHVRLYGTDYYDRLREAGFDVTLWSAFEHDADAARERDLNPREKLTIAKRPTHPHATSS